MLGDSCIAQRNKYLLERLFANVSFAEWLLFFLGLAPFIAADLTFITSADILSALQQPGEPDNYSFRSLTPESETFPHFRPPTVFTVTSPSTHPGGAPTHGSTSDDVVIPAQEGDSTARAVPEAQDVSGEAEAPTTWTDRVLTGEERKGAYVLGGIVVGGFLLGGLLEGSKVEKKVQAVVKGTEEKVAEEKRLV